MTSTTAEPRSVPRRPTLDHPTAMRLAATEYDRFLELLASLSDADWRRPTDCPAWDVRQLACHVLGMAAYAASFREGQRQVKAANRRLQRGGGEYIDALTALQVAERADLDPARIVSEFGRIAPRAARGRRWTPPLIRNRRLPGAQLCNGTPEWWTIGFITDTILTRDTWMHRVDIARAVRQPLHLTADHDGVLIDDVVREWGDRHGRPYDLLLLGPAGGHWVNGTGGAELELDAVEFCRVLSGRGHGDGLLDLYVPF